MKKGEKNTKITQIENGSCETGRKSGDKKRRSALDVRMMSAEDGGSAKMEKMHTKSEKMSSNEKKHGMEWKRKSW